MKCREEFQCIFALLRVIFALLLAVVLLPIKLAAWLLHRLLVVLRTNLGERAFQRVGAFCLAALLTPSLLLPAFASEVNPFEIDFSRTGSVTIYKYDITAAEADGMGDAIAALPTNGESNSAITKALSKYALEKVQFTTFKVAELTTYTDTSNRVELAYNITPSFAYALGLTSSANATASAKSIDGASLTFSSTTLNDTLYTMLTESTLSNTQIKNTLEAFANGLPASDKHVGETDENGCVEFKDLALGLYMVVETTVPQSVTNATDPFFICLPSTNRMDSKNEVVDEAVAGSKWIYDIFANPKNLNYNPDLEKQVREHSEKKANQYDDTCTASEGDVVDCLLTSELAPITSSATYFTEYKFEDTLSKGLIYDSSNGVSISFYKSRKDAEAEKDPVLTWNKNSANFSVQFSKLEDGKSRLTIALTEKGLKTVNATDDGTLVGTADGVSDFSGLIMAVTYRATLTSSADTVLGDSGNPNEVTLTYQRTNDTTSNQLEDKALTFSYGINLTKEFEKGKDGGASAEDYKAVRFTLKNKSDKLYLKASGEDGVYYITGTDESHGTEFTPSSSGSLVINGLEADTYLLTETNTANGYHLLKDSIEIVITGTEMGISPSTASQTGLNNGLVSGDILITSAHATVASKKAKMSADGKSDNARVDMTVVNHRGFDLPKTGGSGNYILIGCGILVAALGVGIILFVRFRKK